MLTTNEGGKLHEVLVGGLLNSYSTNYKKHKRLGKPEKDCHTLSLKAIKSPRKIKSSHLYQINHMDSIDQANISAKELHYDIGNKLRLFPEVYKDKFEHALHASEYFLRYCRSNKITSIEKVYFTANKNDISKLIDYGGDDVTNNADIVIEHKHKKKIGCRYYGVSLKSGKNSKLNNPGLGTLKRLIDEYHKKIFGKCSFSKAIDKIEKEAKKAHIDILKKHIVFLREHFGPNGKTIKNALDTKDMTLHTSAFRFIEKSYKSHHRSLYKTEKDRAKFELIYKQLRVSRTNLFNRKIKASLFTSIHSIIVKAQADKNNHKLIKEFMQKLYNVGRTTEQMPLIRLNTSKNTPFIAKRDNRLRDSKISDANTDFETGFKNSIGKYKVTTNKGTVVMKITSPFGHDVDLSVDASPAGGKSTVSRAGLHVWDKSKF